MGQIRKIDATISGAAWTTNTLPASTGVRVLAWLGSIFGPGIGRLSEAYSEEEQAATIVGGILSKLAEPATLEHIKLLINGMYRNGQGVVFDHDFSGDYGALTAVVVWVLKENFSSFFVENPLVQEVKALLGRQARMRSDASLNASPQT